MHTGKLAAAALALWVLGACGGPAEPADDAGERAQADVAQSSANVIELKAVGMKFEGPASTPSGWTTLKLSNESDMVHFAMIERLPDGVTIEDQVREVTPPFQNGLQKLLAGDADGAMAEFGKLPDWYGDVVFLGGPGLVGKKSGGEATVFLEPGRYTIECYVKTDGVFHSFDPRPGVQAMLHELIVTDEDGGGVEPNSNVTIAVSTNGFEISEGAFRSGPNTIRANFIDQQVYPNFVGHDLHIVKLDNGAGVDEIAAWMDWRAPGGLETSAPAQFVGGINEMPAGEHGYVSADLGAGDYALISEVPDPASHGLLLRFSVN